MARVGTTNLNIGTWTDGENPGAGSQAVDSTGLNGNAIKLDTAVGTEHTAAGAHKTNVIDGPNLKTTVADATTIELVGSPLKLSVKALGIAAAHIAAATITAAKLANGCIDAAAKIVDGIITGAKLAAGTITVTQLANDAVETAKIKDANVTAAKLEYKVYVAALQQAGTGAPSATVYKNTLSAAIVWTRSSTGFYIGTLAGAFTVGKTWCIMGTVMDGTILAVPNDVNTIYILCHGSASLASADSLMNPAFLEIRVYP